VIAGGGLLLLFVFVHPLAHRAPFVRATVGTVITTMALIATALAGMQFVHTRRLRKLLLVAALLILALTELVANTLPAELQTHSVAGFTAILPLAQLFVAATFAAAAFTPSDRVIAGDPRRPLVITVLASLAGFVFAWLAGLLLKHYLFTATRSHGLGIERALQHPLGLVAVLASVGFLAYAAIAFARRGRSERNTVFPLLAAAAALLAAQQLYYLRLPWTVDAITPGQGIGVLALGLMLAAAVRTDLEVRATLTRAAALVERRRVAEDLHDGLAQDLAVIAAHGTQMAQQLGDEHPVAVAAKRALAVTRDTISDLSDMSASKPDQALKAIADELGARFGIGIAVDAHPDALLSPDAVDHVARITREAISNAARHGRAQNVVVSLTRTDAGTSLRVCDDGRGITSGGPAARQEGFGLRNMRERAATLGGQLLVRERKTGGTELEVVLP
jgi:signal transduction histidine kinase